MCFINLCKSFAVREICQNPVRFFLAEKLFQRFSDKVFFAVLDGLNKKSCH